jgi:hypothetical protein
MALRDSFHDALQGSCAAFSSARRKVSSLLGKATSEAENSARTGRNAMTGIAEVYRRSLDRKDDFWAEAAEAIDWQRRWDRVLDDANPPFYRWYAGARLNMC